MFYIGARSRPPHSTTLRRNQKLGKPTRPTRGLNASAHPNGPAQARGTSESGTSAYGGPPSPLPRAPAIPSLTTRRWKTPWTVLKSLLTEQPCPMERNGAARSRGPLGSPSAPSNKTGLPPSPGSWLQAANRIPTTPARGTDPGLSPYCIRLRRTAQPTLIGAYDG